MTLADLTRGFVVVAYCGCGHRADLDLARLAAVKGWDLDTTAIRRCLRCSRCRSRDVEIRVSYRGNITFQHSGTARPPPPATWAS